MKCIFYRNGCTFEGTEEEVDEHVDYMQTVDDPEHRTHPSQRRGTPYKRVRPKCTDQPRLQFDQIHEEFHMTCKGCTMDENLGQEPFVADIVFAWQNHSSMRRREDDSGGPRD